MLRDYQNDTLSHRAGDVELAVETVIFEQLVRQSKSTRSEPTASSDTMLHSVLENVQGAISQLAEHRESDRLEHKRLMDQHARLVQLTESLATSKIETNAPQPPAHSVVPLAEYESTVAQLADLKIKNEELVASVQSSRAERDLAADRLNQLTLAHDKLVAAANDKQREHTLVDSELRELKQQYSALLASTSGSQSEHQQLFEKLHKLQIEHNDLAAAADAKENERAQALKELGKLESEHEKLLALADGHHTEHARLTSQLETLKAERDQLLTASKQQQDERDQLLAASKLHQEERDQLLATSKQHQNERDQLRADSKLHQQELDKLLAASKLHQEEYERLQAASKLQQHEREQLAQQLNELTRTHDELVNSMKASASNPTVDPSQLAAIQANCETLEQQLAQRTSELIESQLLLEDYKSKAETLSIDHNKSQEFLASLRDQLIHERQSVVELRMQVDDLNATIAETSQAAGGETQQLTWDQQKALLLKKLEGESQIGNIDLNKSLEIKDVIERTNQELTKRDGEIMELKRLLAEQSTASQSIAIGAAAVAEMLDHDDFIREERDNLRALQEQLQAKLREAEVEISLERAKLARQRSELEDRIKDCERAVNQPEDGKGSNWRSRLGLGEKEKL
jgi:chromosome segregation ATPase